MTARTDERKKFLLDVMNTAAEGGIGYWSQLSAYHWSVDGKGDKEDLDGFYMLVHEMDGDGGYAGEGHRIDADAIARGLARFREYWKGASRDHDAHKLIAADDTNGDKGDFDAGLADQVVQFAIFGEIIYG